MDLSQNLEIKIRERELLIAYVLQGRSLERLPPPRPAIL
jgi:hypothetical protein